MEKVQFRILDTAVGCRDHGSDDCVALIVVLLHPESEVISQWLHRLITELTQVSNSSFLFCGDAIDDTDGYPAFCFPRDLESSEYRSILRHVRILIIAHIRVIVGSPADPPGIKERITREITIAQHQPEIEYIPSFDEEGPFFLEIGFKSGKVDFRRVGFDLAKIGIDCKI